MISTDTRSSSWRWLSREMTDRRNGDAVRLWVHLGLTEGFTPSATYYRARCSSPRTPIALTNRCARWGHAFSSQVATAFEICRQPRCEGRS
jgi:hypothetical protein